jgi:hypothetical protein
MLNSRYKNIPDEVWDNAHAATLEDYMNQEKSEGYKKQYRYLFL